MKKKYIIPKNTIIAFEGNTILASSNLKYTDEDADANLEVLTNKREQDNHPIWD